MVLPLKNSLYPSKSIVNNKGSYSPWEPLTQDSSKETLLRMLLDVYWSGVHREVKHILTSLSEMRSTISAVEQEYRSDDPLLGLETFTNQVSEHTKDWIELQERRSGMVESRNPQQPRHLMTDSSPPDNMRTHEALAIRQAELQSETSPKDAQYLRAKILLQAAGFLDVDKLVEYREPPETLGIWQKGKAPQLRVCGWSPDYLPIFGAAACALCGLILRGASFRGRNCNCEELPKLQPEDSVCEQCFRDNKHLQHHLIKLHKHCILDDTVTSHLSRKLCSCTSVPRFDVNGKYAALWPINPKLDHRRLSETRYGNCRLFYLPGLVAEAKHRGFKTALESRQRSQNVVQNALNQLKNTPQPNRRRLLASDEQVEDDLDADIPVFLKQYASRFPFGNTHISLMIGPLIIENGVEHSKGGALISSRDPFNYFIPIDSDESHLQRIAISPERKIYTQNRSARPDRRLKACMKQIIGTVFSSYYSSQVCAIEEEFIRCLVTESQFQLKSIRYNTKRYENATKRLVERLKPMLEPRITKYLDKITTQLFDPTVKLRWDYLHNNCQVFCDNILKHEDFGALFAPLDGSNDGPLYLMSFVVRPQGYDRAMIASKYDVPNGLTEEYLLGFRSGRHDDSDIIDTLGDYWYDWGAFGQSLYKHQDLFPWDCTRAYQTSPGKCNSCDIDQHVWAFPFDAWSIIQLHLQKDRRWYCPDPARGHTRLTDKEWMENRFKLFVARNALTRGAVAMASTPAFRASTEWLKTSSTPHLDRLKLGGIHRAQPFSHHFEAGRSVHSLLAPWVHLLPQYRILAYEALRDQRQMKPDVDNGSHGPLFGGTGIVDVMGVAVAESPLPLFASLMANHIGMPDMSGVDPSNFDFGGCDFGGVDPSSCSSIC